MYYINSPVTSIGILFGISSVTGVLATCVSGCSSVSCLNGGHCMEKWGEGGFLCDCSSSEHYGARCEKGAFLVAAFTMSHCIVLIIVINCWTAVRFFDRSVGGNYNTIKVKDRPIYGHVQSNYVERCLIKLMETWFGALG